MRLPLLFLFTLLFTCGEPPNPAGYDAKSTPPTVVYLTRHAEKADGKNPELLPEGTARAERLAERLADENLAAIYATDYRRTQATARPTARVTGLKVRNYLAGADPDSQAGSWRRNHLGETILVVGHSNTVPGLVNALVREERYDNLAENDYDRLFRVRIPARGKATVEELTSN